MFCHLDAGNKKDVRSGLKCRLCLADAHHTYVLHLNWNNFEAGISCSTLDKIVERDENDWTTLNIAKCFRAFSRRRVLNGNNGTMDAPSRATRPTENYFAFLFASPRANWHHVVALIMDLNGSSRFELTTWQVARQEFPIPTKKLFGAHFVSRSCFLHVLKSCVTANSPTVCLRNIAAPKI